MIAIISSIASKLPLAFLERWLTYLEKKNDTDTVRLRDILASQVESRKLKAEVIIAEQGWWVTAMIRPILAYPVAVYYGKIFIWDKALGLGATDPLTPEQSTYTMVIVGFYFFGRPLEKGVRAATDQFGKILKTIRN